MSTIAPLLERQIPRLRRYARSLTQDISRADDLVQSCLVRALTKEHLWQPGTDIRAWLFTILHNQHVNDVRRLVREGIVVSVEDVTPQLAAAPSAGTSLELHDLAQAIAVLPREQRVVVLLAGREGKSYEEIAATLGVPVGTVRSRLSRARARLRVLMDIHEPAPSCRGRQAAVMRQAAPPVAAHSSAARRRIRGAAARRSARRCRRRFPGGD
jgi:RNA polymerase sigma-70 factor (ECF subfamily)